METLTRPDPVQARALTAKAAQWLRLLRFQVHPAAPVFAPGISTYHDMLDPEASDTASRAACAGMLPNVRRAADIEAWRAEGERAQHRPLDQYHCEWRTTERGAALETVVELLEAALAAFDADERAG